MPALEPPSDVGSGGGSTEVLFLHLGLHPSAGRWTGIKKEMGNFQWTDLPFGLILSPYWTCRLDQVVGNTLRSQGVHLIWYVDDIRLLGDSQKSVSMNL